MIECFRMVRTKYGIAIYRVYGDILATSAEPLLWAHNVAELHTEYERMASAFELPALELNNPCDEKL